MADVKISQLPAATTPLDGTELAPIVQSGTTKRVSVANLTVGRALTASSLTLTTPLSAANGGTGLTSLGTGIATFLGTPTSANLAAAVTDETGTGALVFASSPTIATPTLSTSFTSPLHIGGTTASSTLTLQSTSGVGTSDSIVFKVGNNGATTAATFNTSGNLGLGVTPSAWAAVRALQFNYGAIGADSSGYPFFVNNGYESAAGTWTRISGSLGSSRYRQQFGNHVWDVASSGVEGGTISFTQAMTLDANGTFRVKGAGTAGSTDAFLVDGGAPASAARIDSSGNLLVGTTSQVGSALTSISSGTATNTSYRPLSLQGGSRAIFGNRKTTSVSTTATVISSVNEWANLVLVFGTDGTDRFCDLVLWSIGAGTVNPISSLSASGTPAARTYSQSSSTLRVAMASGTYSVHVVELALAEV